MASMDSYSKAAMERTMKIQEVLLRAMARKITWFQAAEILGFSDRHVRRIRERYQEFGYDGLFDRRRGQPSPKRVALAIVEEVLGLYREKYFDLNVRHFHEKLKAEHEIDLSYTWVKAALQGAGLVARAKKRGVHRRRRERRPLPGMLLHIDGSRHQWFPDERWYDLIVILDDATSEIYYAQLVEEESTFTVMAGLKEVIQSRGVFCALYSDRGSHFWLTPKSGGKVDPHRLTQVGRALRELGVQMIPAYSPQARGRSERNFGTWQGRLPQELRLRGIHSLEAANRFLRDHYIAEFNGRFQVPARERGSAFVRRFSKRSGPDFRPAIPAYGQPGQHGEYSEPAVADRTGALASDPGRLHGDDTPTPRRNVHGYSRAPAFGTVQPGRSVFGENKTRLATGCGKAARRKSQKTDFPALLGNPANTAGFPLSHSPDGCWRLT
jgi:transposase